jgi:hypothetical protein
LLCAVPLAAQHAPDAGQAQHPQHAQHKQLKKKNLKVGVTSPTTIGLSFTQAVITVPAGTTGTCPTGSTAVPTTVLSNGIYRGLTSGSETLYATISPATAQSGTISYSDTGGTAGFTPGQTYFYKVNAANCNGPSPLGSEASVMWPLPTSAPVPAAPTGLAATPLVAGIVLKWNPVLASTNGEPIQAPVYYNVIRCEIPCAGAGGVTGGPNLHVVVNSSPLICPEYFDNKVLAGTPYYYWVKAWMPAQGSSRPVSSGFSSVIRVETPST